VSLSRWQGSPPWRIVAFIYVVYLLPVCSCGVVSSANLLCFFVVHRWFLVWHSSTFAPGLHAVNRWEIVTIFTRGFSTCGRDQMEAWPQKTQHGVPVSGVYGGMVKGEVFSSVPSGQ
jgi:hypothetical protein